MESQTRVKLHSRDRVDNWLVHYKDTTYLLQSELDYIRVGYMNSDHDIIAFVDPPGGPMMSVGNTVDEIGKDIASISHIKGKGFAITFKK